MGTHRHILKTLRSIALEHAGSAHPDLASMARELGRVVHRDAAALAARLGSLRQRRNGLDGFALVRRSKPPLSVVIMAWPPNHAATVPEYAGGWGLELALVGALEVQSWRREADAAEPTLQGRDWLGPGDGCWFEGEASQLRRCRNLSRHETALSLHVYGVEPGYPRLRGQFRPAGQPGAAPAHVRVADPLHG